MMVRDYRPEDATALRAMFDAQKFAYTFPDLEDPLFIAKIVLEDNDGKPVQAILGRLTTEAYFLEDPSSAPPLTRMRRFLSLHEKACDAGRRAGVDSIHVWLPPEVKEKFGPQLERLGWEEFTWATFMKRLGG